MEVIRIPIDQLHADPNNAKEHPEWQVEQIKNSIEQFGNLDPIAVWGPDNLIVEGHGRLLALKELGYREAEVIRLDWLTEEERRAYALAHNKLTMNSGFDLDALKINMDAIEEIDMSLFGFRNGTQAGDWFEDHERNDTSGQEGNEEYNDFVEKFEQKKTTDDCYTPDIVYEAVASYVVKKYGKKRDKFVRPFYPGGDYQKENYPAGSVVVDNPPFSILTEILKFYEEKGVPFFLFAPTMTLFTGRGCDLTYLTIGVGITYENGAVVNTSFITNMEKGTRVRTDPELFRALKEANDENKKELTKQLPKYEMPPEVITAAVLSRYSVHGVEFSVSAQECERIGELDAMKECGKSLFGGGFLISEQAAKRNKEAAQQKEENVRREEQERLEKAAQNIGSNEGGVVVWNLSDRERDIVKRLGSNPRKKTAEA